MEKRLRRMAVASGLVVSLVSMILAGGAIDGGSPTALVWGLLRIAAISLLAAGLAHWMGVRYGSV